jgi:hypothetical protein
MKMPDSDESAHPRKTPPVQPVRGKVLLDGKPVADARVVFRLDAFRRWQLEAYTEADGSFVLTTYSRHDGAPAGDYDVAVVLRRADPTDPDRLGPNLLPDRYADPATSGLKAAVQAGDNYFRFNLSR